MQHRSFCWQRNQIQVYWSSFSYAQVYTEKPNHGKNVFTQCLFAIDPFMKNQPDWLALIVKLVFGD